MALTATQVIDRDMPEKLVRDINGDTGERWYRVEGVNAIDEIGSSNEPVSGLPKLEEAWSENESELVVVRILPEWWSYSKETIGGVVKVKVEYATSEASGGGTIVPAPRPKNETTKWTSYTTSQQSQQILYGYIPGGGINPEPINNGKGMNIEIGVLNIEVVVHYREDHNLILAPLLALANPRKVNENVVELPPLWGGKIKLTFQPGELLYLGHQAEMVETSR